MRSCRPTSNSSMHSHGAVTAAFDRYDAIKSGVRGPRLFDIIPDTGEFWQQHLALFPANYRTRSALVQMERILPLPKVVRKH